MQLPTDVLPQHHALDLEHDQVRFERDIERNFPFVRHSFVCRVGLHKLSDFLDVERQVQLVRVAHRFGLDLPAEFGGVAVSGVVLLQDERLRLFSQLGFSNQLLVGKAVPHHVVEVEVVLVQESDSVSV